MTRIASTCLPPKSTSVEKSEYLSRLLAKAGVRHEVLNAKNHAREAVIVAQAGRFGAVTVATNMAGRGTDIMLGGNTEFLAAAELVAAAEGQLAVGGKAEGAKDVQIWLSRFDGKVWSKPEVVGSETGQPCWNPVLFHTRDGRLWLYYKFGPKPEEWTAGRLFSDDEGATWSKPGPRLRSLISMPLACKNWLTKSARCRSDSRASWIASSS